MNFQKITRYIQQHGIGGFFVRIYQKFWPLQKSCVYLLSKKSEFAGDTPDLIISRFGSFGELDDDVFSALESQEVERLRSDFKTMFLKGRELWLGFLKGQLAGVCWSSTNLQREDYFVPLSQQEATIFSCFVLEPFRGRGIYPTMLKRIVNQYFDDKKKKVCIDCKQWNQASIRGIEKTGFGFLGTAWRLKIGSWTSIFARSWKRREAAYVNPYGKRGFVVRIFYLLTAVLWWICTGFGCFGRKGMVVLCYHGILPHQVKGFGQQMKYVCNRTAVVGHVPTNGIRFGQRLKVCVTFDDAFVCLREYALPVLKEYGIPSVIFVPSGFLNQTPGWEMPEGHPESRERICSEFELKEIFSDEYVSAGSHSHTHPDLTTLDADGAVRELKKSKDALEKMLDTPVKDFAFPHGRYSKEICVRALNMGYQRVFTLDPQIVCCNEGVQGRFSMSPNVWPIEFKLTAAGAYVWLHLFRKWVRFLRGIKGSAS